MTEIILNKFHNEKEKKQKYEEKSISIRRKKQT